MRCVMGAWFLGLFAHFQSVKESRKATMLTTAGLWMWFGSAQSITGRRMRL